MPASYAQMALGTWSDWRHRVRIPAILNTVSSDELPLWPPLLATRGPGASSDPHKHHAMHLVLALEGEVAVRRTGGSDRADRHRAVGDLPRYVLSGDFARAWRA
jgi:hypothetical protein